MAFRFELQKTDSKTKGRAGIFHTLHGSVETPVFMPVGTFASVKTISTEELQKLNAPIILGNTYHLFLRPGAEVFERLGGIHGFMGWQRPVLTDSGGFQLFSLPGHRKITEEGAVFRSYTDGRFHLLSPEVSIVTQAAIGSDIMMVLDECVSSTSDRKETERAMQLTHRWALRSLNARNQLGVQDRQALFAIAQGGTLPDLRKTSADFLTQHAFDGFAIGGLAVGETKSEREDMTEIVAELLPQDKPRYLMGVGTPVDLLEAVRRGVDMFDCILPTKFAQQGVAFTSKGRVSIYRTTYRFHETKLDDACDCPTCERYSLAYLHHLVKCQEPLGWRLVAMHNLTFYLKLMREIRQSILEERFEEFYRETLSKIAFADTVLEERAKKVAPSVPFEVSPAP